MAPEIPARPHRSNAYSIFILILTVFSLGIMVLLVLPRINEQTVRLLIFYDNIICVFFLIDFFLNLRAAPSKRHYFINEGGWLDLIGSIPSFGFFKYTALLRLARLSRASRIARQLRGDNRKALLRDVIQNRGHYALVITALAAFIVLTNASILVLEFETNAPPDANANITDGGDALWYSLVTITTVGYGDRYPVTPGGRTTAVFIMIAGVGIIGALASILASILVPPPKQEEEPDPAALAAPTVQQELAAVKGELSDVKIELAGLRQLLTDKKTT